MRYYFDLCTANMTTLDDEGTELSGVDGHLVVGHRPVSVLRHQGAIAEDVAQQIVGRLIAGVREDDDLSQRFAMLRCASRVGCSHAPTM